MGCSLKLQANRVMSVKKYVSTIGSVDKHGSPYRNYLSKVVGGNSCLDLLRYELITGLLGGRPGAVGTLLRSFFYSYIMNLTGKVFLGRDISLRCPGKITIEGGCFLDDNVRLDAKTGGDGYILIRKHSVIRSFTLISTGGAEGFVDIGANCFIGQSCQLHGYGGLKIGNNVLLAGPAFVAASSHVADRIDIPIKDQGITIEGVQIGNGCWIGAGVTILDGVKIGDGSVIGAGAVVTNSIPPFSIAVGIPARVVKGRAESDSGK